MYKNIFTGICTYTIHNGWQSSYTLRDKSSVMSNWIWKFLQNVPHTAAALYVALCSILCVPCSKTWSWSLSTVCLWEHRVGHFIRARTLIFKQFHYTNLVFKCICHNVWLMDQNGNLLGLGYFTTAKLFCMEEAEDFKEQVWKWCNFCS